MKERERRKRVQTLTYHLNIYICFVSKVWSGWVCGLFEDVGGVAVFEELVRVLARVRFEVTRLFST